MKKTIKVGIIGFGNIGKKRFNALQAIRNYNIKTEFIVDKNKPKKIKKGIEYFTNWKSIVSKNVDLIILSTPTEQSKKIIRNLCGKFHILVEKPLSNNPYEIKQIINKSNSKKKFLKVGYNLRFDDGLIKTKKLLQKNSIGKIYYLKIIYANGAAKTNTNKVGSLLDMGTHSINLLIWLTNNEKFRLIKSLSQKNEFFKKTKVDNGFLLLKHKNIHSFIHHGFCTWKNKFYVEISDSKGFIRINSLSKWKNEKVSFGARKLPDGKPTIKEWIFKKDNSWKNELLFVFNEIIKNKNNFKKFNLESYKTINIIKKLI